MDFDLYLVNKLKPFPMENKLLGSFMGINNNKILSIFVIQFRYIKIFAKRNVYNYNINVFS